MVDDEEDHIQYDERWAGYGSRQRLPNIVGLSPGGAIEPDSTPTPTPTHPLAVVMIGFSFLHSTLASESQIAAFELPLDLPCALTFPSRLSRGQPSTATMTIRS